MRGDYYLFNCSKILAMKIQTWFDVFDSGNKLWNNFEEYQKQMKSLKPGRYIITTEKVENKRSLEQNNAMWGIPYMFFEKALLDIGEFLHPPSKKQVHEYCMHYCLPEDYKERLKKKYDEMPAMVDKRTGELFKSAFRLTTTEMSTVDAMHYYENLQNFYAEYFSSGENDLIPDPDLKKSKKYKQKV
jgi:hypothetical protein